MKKGIDIVKKLPEIFIVHHNLPGKKVKKENDGVHHLIIPISGQVKVETGGTTHRFGPTKMIYIPSGCPHEFESSSSGSGERLVALIEDQFWKSESDSKLGPTLLNTNTLVKELLLHLLLSKKSSHHKSLAATLVAVISDLVTELGDQSFRIEHILAKTVDERLKKALHFLVESASEKYSASELARASGMSSRNLSRLFSENFGVNPKQMHSKLKIDLATELLKEKKLNVTEVCFEVGFSSLSQFTKSFKKSSGKLPSEV